MCNSMYEACLSAPLISPRRSSSILGVEPQRQRRNVDCVVPMLSEVRIEAPGQLRIEQESHFASGTLLPAGLRGSELQGGKEIFMLELRVVFEDLVVTHTVPKTPSRSRSTSDGGGNATPSTSRSIGAATTRSIAMRCCARSAST